MPHDHITSTPCAPPEPERWLPVPRWPVYEASDLGRIRSYWIGGRKARIGTTPKMLRGAIHCRSGYRMVSLRYERRNRHVAVHRLILEAFAGPCEPGMEVCHNDGDRSNNRLSNLRWDTRSANVTDALSHGTQHLAKLTKADVVTIWARLVGGGDVAAIAREYDVHKDTIRNIRRGKCWWHVTSNLPGWPLVTRSCLIQGS